MNPFLQALITGLKGIGLFFMYVSIVIIIVKFIEWLEKKHRLVYTILMITFFVLSLAMVIGLLANAVGIK